jgi:hemoglobin
VRGAKPVDASLYERLGGETSITAVVDAFVGRCAVDDRINGKFARTDVPRLKKMLVDQIVEATGGPAGYAGRSMTETHRGMGVTAGEFDALVEDLVRDARWVRRAEGRTGRPPRPARSAAR